MQVEKFNGTKLRNLAHLVELITACKDEFFVFDLQYGESLVLKAEAAHASTAGILKAHNIPLQMSAELRAATGCTGAVDASAGTGHAADGADASASAGAADAGAAAGAEGLVNASGDAAAADAAKIDLTALDAHEGGSA
jgi:PDZ domain